MAICANPVCRLPFERKTTTQKYCECCDKNPPVKYIPSKNYNEKEVTK